jgi:ankyrin repeat protein
MAILFICHAWRSHYLFGFALLVTCSLIAQNTAYANEDTPFLKAVRTGNYPDVKRALTKDAMLDRDRYGNTAVMIAASRNYYNIMQLLIENGGDAHSTNNAGVTALMIAAAAGRTIHISSLIKLGVDLEAKDHQGKTALLYAAGRKGSATLDALLTHGANPAAVDNKGNTAMIYAASANSVGSLSYLAEYDQYYDSTNKQGQSPLMIASSRGNLESVKALIEGGASVDQKSNAGETSLMLAVYNKHIEVVRELLSAGADRNLASKAGHTAVSLAKTYGDTKMQSELDTRVEVEGNRITMRTDLSGDHFKTSTGELLQIAVLNGKALAIDETIGRYMEVYGGMPLSEFIQVSARSGIKPVRIEDNLFRIGKQLKGTYAFRNEKLLGFVAGREPRQSKDNKSKLSQSSEQELRLSGNILSLLGASKPEPVISDDAPIFKDPPITKGAGFLRTSPSGMYQVFEGRLLAFDKDIAEVLVENYRPDIHVTIRCRISINTRGIHYSFESVDSLAEQLRYSTFTKPTKKSSSAISSDSVRKWINKSVSIAPAGEKCAHFELL